MDINNKVDALDIEKNINRKAARTVSYDSSSALFLVISLAVGWLVVLLVMMNGGHGLLY